MYYEDIILFLKMLFKVFFFTFYSIHRKPRQQLLCNCLRPIPITLTISCPLELCHLTLTCLDSDMLHFFPLTFHITSALPPSHAW